MAADLRPEKNVAILTGTPQSTRQILRRQLLERRLALSSDEWARHSKAICEHLQAFFPQLAGLRVGFCWPIQNEPDLRPLLETWMAAGNPRFSALLPVVVAENAPLAFRRWAPAMPLHADRYGIPTPAEGDFILPEALLLPVNGFDTAGYRLGYGGGYFDRTLAALHAQGLRPLTIGLGFELARVDSISPEAHDQPLDAVVTEAGLFMINGAAG
jgi:5,10-methenyltetrahydrofolate synthetase